MELDLVAPHLTELFGRHHHHHLITMPGHDLRAIVLRAPDQLAEPLLGFLNLPWHRPAF
jgi:hypothetical protein